MTTERHGSAWSCFRVASAARASCAAWPRCCPPSALTAVVNTGDDFEHWGLHVSPDLDTVMYTLAGLVATRSAAGASPRRASRAFEMLEALRRSRTGSASAIATSATHLARTRALSGGATLSQVTDRLRRALGVEVPILPMAEPPAHPGRNARATAS